jgi:chromosomal replication initiator protein
VKTRYQVLDRLCKKNGTDLPESALKTLSQQCSGDARLLQGVAHRLGAQQRILGRSITEDEALRCSLDLIRASQPVIRMTDIEKVVCEAFGLEDKMLRAKSKCQNVSQPRMLAMFLARKYTRTALSEIGEYFGNRQHSTVISAQKKVEQWLESDDVIGCGRGQIGVREILKSLEATLQVG